MSTEQSIDPYLIEQTKQQIRALVAEIAQLAKEDISPEEFYGGFLTRVVSALAAVGGAIWTTNDEGRLALQYQINIQETKLREDEEAQAQHSRMLYKVLSDGEAVILPPHSSAGGEDGEIGNPTDFLLLFGLLKTDLETGGIVEVFQRSDSGAATQKGYLRFLVQMCELAAEYLKSHQLRHFSDRQSLWTQLEDFTRVVHASLDPRETAFTIANEGRRLIECDRLSVAIRKGNKCTIESISGQDVFDKRSNLVRLLNKLASAVVATGDPIWYTGDTRDMAPQVEDAVQEYVDEAHSKTVAVLPLRRPEPPEEDDPKKRPEPQPTIGALIVEQIEDSRVPPSMLPRVEVVCRHSSAALANSLEHQSLFLMPLWRAIGKSRWVVQARTLPKTLSIGGAVLAVVLILCLWQKDFELESKGTLEPVERRNVFANIDGVVHDIPVEQGDLVKEGQLLVQLRSTEVEVALEEVEGQLKSSQERYSSLQHELIEDHSLKTEERNRKAGDMAEVEQTLIGLQAEKKILKAKQAELAVKSPLDGIVVTWDLKNRLLSRPVQHGWLLMKIADPKKEWQLELHMPEQRMGFVEEAQKKLYVKEREMLREMLLEQRRAEAPKTPEKEPAAAADSANVSGPSIAAANTSPSAETATIPAAEPANPPANEFANNPPAAEPAEDPLAVEVEAELAKIPDEGLHDRWSQLVKTKLDAQLKEILKDLPEGDAKNRLGEILQQPNYEQKWENLAELIKTLAEEDLKTRLTAIPQEHFIDENVTFISATDPGKSLRGRITEIHHSAEVRGEEGNTVLIKVAIDKSQLTDPRPGATVTAKVHCGRASLGYVWLHEVVSFIQTRIIFRYF